MSYQLGDVVPLSVTITDADGNPADAGSVTLTVTLPDGTTDVTSDITSTTTGVYDHDYTTTQAGRHAVRWVATGDNASAYTDAFTVEASDDRTFISLAETKTHLRKTDSKDDAELTGYITAACAKIVELIGQVSPITDTEEWTLHRPVRRLIPRTQPVLSVTSVEYAGTPTVTIPQADADTGTPGWVLDPGGVIRHTTYFGRGTVRVTLRAGRSPVPGNIRLAALELTGHLWRSTKLNGSGGRPPIQASDDLVIAGQAYALPNRVKELLGLGRLPTGDVLVG